eukprot:3869799-Pleurochrysis_carterae.AAC.4
MYGIQRGAGLAMLSAAWQHVDDATLQHVVSARKQLAKFGQDQAIQRRVSQTMPTTSSRRQAALTQSGSNK